MASEDHRLAVATHEIRQVLMLSFAYTPREVDYHARPLAQTILRSVDAVDDARAALRRVDLIKTHRDKDGRDFVYADDLREALGRPGLGQAS